MFSVAIIVARHIAGRALCESARLRLASRFAAVPVNLIVAYCTFVCTLCQTSQHRSAHGYAVVSTGHTRTYVATQGYALLRYSVSQYSEPLRVRDMKP